ncbi:MAG: divalent metal cation transporter [Bacteroidota bacterium]|nr:divalent metal cation transporter [Bacteroidota bacterium]
MASIKKSEDDFKDYIKSLGPGLITGASDDDPSGIATYSQAGAAFGLSTLWTAWITFPLMAGIQEMCARIGMVTCSGLTNVIKKHYSKKLLYVMLLLSFPAITLNIGADIAGMGAVSHLLLPAVPSFAFSIAFTIVLMYIIIQYSYKKLAAILKWLCLVLFLYFIVPFLVTKNWGDVLKNTFIPTFHFDRNFCEILVAILGTTISPYLFFWQANMEAENQTNGGMHIMVDKLSIRKMRSDVITGMFFSNLVMFFIILTTGIVLFNAGIHHIDTVEQAAQALKPLAGNLSYLLFAAGVIGTGLLSIPVLAGSLSYILSETFDWEEGLDKKFSEAKGFYVTIIVSLLIGLFINLTKITPFQALFITAIVYGVTAPVLVGVILHISNNKKIMGDETNGKISNFLGILTFVLMSAAAVALIYFQFE